jgi:UDP-3-O-[3-hydroxymyristoyl] glucosamine N-acyltransferase
MSTPPASAISATSGAVAAALGGTLVGRADVVLTAFDPIESAGPTSLTFIRAQRFASMWAASRAGAALVTRGVDVPGHDAEARALIVVDDADVAMVKLLHMAAPPPPARPAGVHPTASVDPTAKVAPTAHVGPLCSVLAGATIGERAVLIARVHVGAGASVGDGTMLHPGVVIEDRCAVGRRCILHGNVVIGADGFGFLPSPRGLLKVPHIGTVEIHDDVEIGAVSCVDRGKIGPTIIGAGTKIDNHVQIAHNVRIGSSCVIAAMTGIAGSVTIGNGVRIAGHSGVADNLHIGDGATIAAKSGVMKDVPAGQAWLGYPARAHGDQLRTWAAVAQLPAYMRYLKRMAEHADEVEHRPVAYSDRSDHLRKLPPDA